jgi:hypothetical protein
LTTADTGTGNIVGVFGDQGILIVPQGYASGTPLVDTATYLNETFDKLGVIPGTYVSKWGAGPNQNFTLIIGFVVGNPGPGGPPGPVTVPEPASAALLATALAGLLLTGTIRRARSDA